MNHKTPISLPSLAHPLVLSSQKGVKKDDDRLCLPPFPEINLGWDGFTVPHLQWIGINISADENWQKHLAFWHESAHNDLARTSFSRLIKFEMLRMYAIIQETFEEGQKYIPVPVTPTKLGNEIQSQWEKITGLTRGPICIEEVFAVYRSLLKTRRDGLIENDELLYSLIKEYKAIYEKEWALFPDIYDAFDIMAGEIGEIASVALIFNMFETLNPVGAFSDLIYVLSTKGPCAIDAIANYSIEDADSFFTHLTARMDPDDLLYQRRLLSDIIGNLDKSWNSLTEEYKDGIYKFLLSSPSTFLYTQYNNDSILPFHDLLRNDYFSIEEVRYGDFYVLLEDIRQQLTQGKGLLCP